MTNDESDSSSAPATSMTAEEPLRGWVDRALGGACALMLAALAGVLVLQVVMRYGVGSSLTWVDEVSRVLMIWLTFTGAALAYRTRSHIAITALHGILRRRPRGGQVLATVVEVVVAAGSVALLVGGAIIVALTLAHRTPALQLPVAVLFAPAPLCGAVVLASAISRWVGRSRSRSLEVAT